VNDLGDLLRGDLSPAARIWTALAPAMLLTAWFFVAAVAYGLRTLRHGPYRDAEIEARGSSVLLGLGVRRYFSWAMLPVWRFLRWTGLPPAAITSLSLLLALASGVALSAGRFALGGWLYILSGICDFFDGRLARLHGTAGPRGAALDSIFDRYSDTAVLAGLAWYYRDSWVLLCAIAALVGGFITSYVRARGESLGVATKDIGLMQRPERIVCLGVCVAFSPVLAALYEPDAVRPTHVLAVVGLVFLAISTQLTAARRATHLLAALGGAASRPLLDVGRGSHARNVVSSVLATASDFVVVASLVGLTVLHPGPATIVGATVGGLIDFTVRRKWAFETAGQALPQAARYALVSLSGALLNGGGVVVLLLLPGMDYRLAWVVVRATVWLAWSFPLQRDYVFGAGEPSSEEGRHVV
jgi:phosphatidylglycerophosphate synthase/putative flippase GtrA